MISIAEEAVNILHNYCNAQYDCKQCTIKAAIKCNQEVCATPDSWNIEKLKRKETL